MTDTEKFEFQPEHDGMLTLNSAVFQALGAASVCWDSLQGAGIFDSTRALHIGEALLAVIQTELDTKSIVHSCCEDAQARKAQVAELQAALAAAREHLNPNPNGVPLTDLYAVRELLEAAPSDVLDMALADARREGATAVLDAAFHGGWDERTPWIDTVLAELGKGGE